MLAESVVHRPPAVLRPFVAKAVGYRYEGLAPGLHRGLPSPHLTLVLTLDEPLVMAAHPDPRQAPGAHDALVGGLHTRAALIATGTRQFGVQLALTPAGARALLGLPAGALASTDVELADLLGRPADALVDRLRTATDWAARFAVLDAVLTGLLRDELGFAGAVVTDALDMAGASPGGDYPTAAVRSLAAGADLCCLGPVPDERDVAAVLDAVVAAVRDVAGRNLKGH